MLVRLFLYLLTNLVEVWMCSYVKRDLKPNHVFFYILFKFLLSYI